MANHNRPTNAFATGNELYKRAFNPGKPRKFETPEALWEAACTYFEYCVDNPITYQVPSRHGTLITKYKVQAMTIQGLCFYIELSDLKYYKTLPEYKNILCRINDVMYVHNFTHTAAGLLQTRIMSRMLLQR